MFDRESLQARLNEIAADCVRRLALVVDRVEPGLVSLSMPVLPELVHGGGVLCGQAILSVADTAMLLAMMAQLGEFKPMTTVQLQTTFLRPIPADSGHVAVVGKVLRLGKTLSYGEVEFRTPDGKLAAHATSTYAML